MNIQYWQGLRAIPAVFYMNPCRPSCRAQKRLIKGIYLCEGIAPLQKPSKTAHKGSLGAVLGHQRHNTHATLRPHRDQWAYLASVQPMAPHDIEPTVLRATCGIHPLDVTFIDDEDLATP